MDDRTTIIDQRYSNDLFEEVDSVEEDATKLLQVYLRLKPSNVPSSLYEVRGDQCLITSVDTATAGHRHRTQHNVSKMYTFSHIFGPKANQKEIFEHVVKNNLRELPDGNSFTLLTYGASGSGKTYTLMGTVKAPGLVPQSLEYVFKVVEAAQMPLYRPGELRANKLSIAQQEHELQWVRHLRHVSAPLREKYRRMSTQLCSDFAWSTVELSNRTKHYVWVSFVEIYNEAIYDLLVTTDRTAASKLRIREDPTGNVYVKGATQAFVRTGEEAYDVLVAGKRNLQMHATGVHAHSSRSHCIFTITMLTETEFGVRASHVRLCDLAGSERVRCTRNTGARMQESRTINSSLHVLHRCLQTLRRKQANKQDLVPYRESKLTRLLGTGLSGTRGEAVSMVVTLNPAPEYAHETRHVLQLAAIARHIQVNPSIAESVSTLESSCSQDTTLAGSAEVTRLRADIERLHYELEQAEALIRRLMKEIEQKQQDNAVNAKEFVAEARDIEQQYYKQHIRSLEERQQAEIAELREEYEAKLAAAVVAHDGATLPALQNKVMQLMKQIAILEEELNAERLAKACMNEEMLHLRACIEEGDEKAAIDISSEEDVIQLLDSENDCDEADDLCNDSLEPTFKKEDINRSRLIRQSNFLNNTRNTTFDNKDKTHDMLKDDSISDRDIIDVEGCKRDSTITEAGLSNNDTIDQSMECLAMVKKADVKKDSMSVSQESVSTLESSCSQDTPAGLAGNAEVTRLRADNERLHYELVQLMKEMAEKQQDNAVTAKEFVAEARDIEQQYYKQHIRSLEERQQAEIAELREEYEAKLAAAVVAHDGATLPALQNKVMQLMKQIAILEEELNAERLAKACMNEEILHLRACIEEGDDKAAIDISSEEDVIQLLDSENDCDEADDLCNDSLEPTFKKEDINRSRLIRQSNFLNNTRNTTFDNKDKTHDMLKDDSISDRDIIDVEGCKRDSTITEAGLSNNDTIDQSMECLAMVKKADVKKDSMSVSQESVSTLESSCSQDTPAGLAGNAEVTRLRADNERLHYELVQAEALIRRLMKEMAEKQQDNAVTAKEFVAEARDIEQQYYKQHIRSLEERQQAEIAELREEYEAKLAAAVVTHEGATLPALRNKVMQLMKHIAILEEELNAERLAKACMNEEILHLRACIEEEDEKATIDISSEEDA